MARRNASDSASGRRGSSRTNSGGGSFSGKRKSSDKPFKKSASGSAARGSSSFFKKEGGGAFRKKKDAFESRQEGKRPFKKSDKPYGKREEGSSESSGRSFGTRKTGFSSDARKSGGRRSFDKGDKPFKRRDEGTSNSRGGDRRDSRFKKSPDGPPYKRSYEKKDGDVHESSGRSYGNRKSGFSSGSRKSTGNRSFDKDGKPSKRRDADTSSSGGKRRDSKFKKGPSFGLPYKRSYDKKDTSKGSGESRFKKYSDRDTGKSFDKRDRADSREKRPSSGERAGNKPTKSFGRLERNGKPPRERKNISSGEKRFFDKAKSRDSEGKTLQDESFAPAQTEKIRLNKYIANSGVCSRREADELITMGLVSVNGKTITELGYKVNPGDEVRYENKVLKAEKHVYILLNKPKGYLTTTDDPQERKTVMQIIGSAVKERIYPVGRLDRNTTGLLLLTNDGDLAEKLMHPSYNVKKIYKVELNRPLSKADFQAVQEGVMLEEGRASVDDIAIISDDGKTIGIEIHIGWNRVVRRIFESLDYEVIRLDRSVYAGLDKKNLERGHWRFLTKEEIVRIKHYK